MQGILNWLADIWNFIGYWLAETFKEVAKWGTGLWGLVLLVGTLLWTVVTHIIPILTLMLDTLNGLVTGNWNYAPPSSIMGLLAIANTFCPLQECITYLAGYGVLKGGLALFRFVKNLIPTEAGT